MAAFLMEGGLENELKEQKRDEEIKNDDSLQINESIIQEKKR